MNKLIGALDETGMGAFAGPLVVVTVAFRATFSGLSFKNKDSKKLSAKKRQELLPEITKEAAFIGLGWATPTEIEEYGLAEAWQKAALRSLKNCPELEILIVDGLRPVNSTIKQKVEPRADENWWQCSAASVVAKEVRDAEMTSLAKHYPKYGWDTNAGYGTKQHREALEQFGMTPFHRPDYCKS